MQTATQQNQARSLDIMVPGVLDKLFGEHTYQYDLVEGTVLSVSDARIVYFTTDLIRGVQSALEYETGDAWAIVLEKCGYHCGMRVSQALRNDLRLVTKTSLDDLPVDDFLEMVERYFSSNGWGQLKIDLNDAQDTGIIDVILIDSIFVESLHEQQGLVDTMVAGMLRGIFESISGQTLGCTQVTCDRQGSGSVSRFLVSGSKRIAAIEQPVKQGISFDAAREHLLSA